MAQQSPNMWAEKLVESLDRSLKKKGESDRLHDNMKKRLNDQHREIVQGFTQVVMQIQNESSGDAWSSATELTGAILHNL